MIEKLLTRPFTCNTLHGTHLLDVHMIIIQLVFTTALFGSIIDLGLFFIFPPAGVFNSKQDAVQGPSKFSIGWRIYDLKCKWVIYYLEHYLPKIFFSFLWIHNLSFCLDNICFIIIFYWPICGKINAIKLKLIYMLCNLWFWEEKPYKTFFATFAKSTKVADWAIQ